MTRVRPSTSLFWRVEATQVETDVLRTGQHLAEGGRKNAHVIGDGSRDFVGAVSAGVTWTVWRPKLWDVALGGQLTGYAVPGSLSPFYGRDPWSVQAFVRVRPPSMHRMWDTIMSRDGSGLMAHGLCWLMALSQHEP